MADDELRCWNCGAIIPAPTLVCKKPECVEAAREAGADDE